MYRRGEVIKPLAQIVRVFRALVTRERELRVRLRADVEATIYDRPGLWMKDGALARLSDDIQAVARAAIPGPLRYGVLLPQRDPFQNSLIVVGRNSTSGEVVGFNALPWLAVRLRDRICNVMHFGLLVIHPRYQRQGLQGLLYGLGAFSVFHRSGGRPVWVSNVTAVPAVFGAVCEQVRDAYPHYRSVRPPPARHRELASAIFAQHRHQFGVARNAQFDGDRFIITGSYTGGAAALKKSLEHAPRHRDNACNDFCAAQLDYGRGDDFLQIGLMDARVIANWITRRIPSDLRPALARQIKLAGYATAREHAPPPASATAATSASPLPPAAAPSKNG